MSLLMGPEGVLVEYIAATEHQTRGTVFTKRGTTCAEERNPER